MNALPLELQLICEDEEEVFALELQLICEDEEEALPLEFQLICVDEEEASPPELQLICLEAETTFGECTCGMIGWCIADEEATGVSTALCDAQPSAVLPLVRVELFEDCTVLLGTLLGLLEL